MASISFHQVIRSTTPLVTTLVDSVVYGRTFPKMTYLSLMPIVLGVSIATYGDLTYTNVGLAVTLLGVILSTLKTVVTNKLLTGRLALSPLEILFRMSPLACGHSLIMASWQGELGRPFEALNNVLSMSSASRSSSVYSANILGVVLLGNGVLAFVLNMSSFNTNKLAGPLTMSVCANIKQCVTIVLGTVLFDTTVTTMNLWGIAITLVGGMAYGLAELRDK